MKQLTNDIYRTKKKLELLETDIFLVKRETSKKEGIYE